MRDPYVKVPLSIITSDLKPQSKVLLAYMINFKNMNGGEKPICKSARELGEAVNLTSTTVQRSLAELESRGLIEVQKGHVSSYFVQPNMGQDQPNMGQDQPNMGQDQPNMGRFNPNRVNPIHLYIKENKKESLKQISKSARTREREEYQFSPDLFDRKRKAD